MKVQELARQEQISADTIRHYVRIGLLQPGKADNGYHIFSGGDQKRLRFIRQARDLGFTLDDIQKILHEAGRGSSPCPTVRQLIEPRLQEARNRLQAMQALVERMESAVAGWQAMPDCYPSGDHICHLIESCDATVVAEEKSCE